MVLSQKKKTPPSRKNVKQHQCQHTDVRMSCIASVSFWIDLMFQQPELLRAADAVIAALLAN